VIASPNRLHIKEEGGRGKAVLLGEVGIIENPSSAIRRQKKKGNGSTAME